MENINGTKIRLERLSEEELLNLKEHVQAKVNEVMEDHRLVSDEINRRNPEVWQDPLDQVQEQLPNFDLSGSSTV